MDSWPADRDLIPAMNNTKITKLNNNMEKNAARGSHIRKLGKQETFFYWSQIKFDGGAQILLSLMVETDEALEVNMLEEALQTLQDRVQVLRCRVQDLDGELWLTESARQRVQVQLLPRGDDWRDQYERILNDETLDLERGPMWRVLLLQDPSNTGEDDADTTERHRAVIYMVISHVISDGMSNMFLVGQLLDILDHQQKKQPYLQTEPVPVKESLEISLKDTMPGWSWSYLCFLLISGLLIIWHKICNWRRKSFSQLFLRPCRTVSGHRNHAIHTVFSRQTTSGLLAACKHHGVTVGSLLMAATNLASARLTAEERPGVQPRACSPIINVVSLKRHLPPQTADYVCSETIGLVTYVPLLSDASALWTMARQAHSGLKRRLDDRYALMVLQLVYMFWRPAGRPLPGPGPWMPFTITRTTDTAFYVNNFGRMDARMPRTSRVRILQLHTVAKQHPDLDLSVGVHLFGSVAGRLQYDLNYTDGSLEPRHAERFSQIIVKILEQSVKQHVQDS